MNISLRKYFEDILFSIATIELHIRSIKTLFAYENNITVMDAVERRLAVIGEALHQVDKRDNTIVITNKAKIIKLRHILVHDYNLIENATIWNIIINHLPVLKSEVLALVNSFN